MNVFLKAIYLPVEIVSLMKSFDNMDKINYSFPQREYQYEVRNLGTTPPQNLRTGSIF